VAKVSRDFARMHNFVRRFDKLAVAVDLLRFHVLG
jgi:hypothetical protein